jgi:hypothetical protein
LIARNRLVLWREKYFGARLFDEAVCAVNREGR